MTAQISDVVVYRRKSRSIAGVNGSGLFDPARREHGGLLVGLLAGPPLHL